MMRTRLRTQQTDSSDRSMKIKFSTQNQRYDNLHFSKTTSDFDMSTNVRPTDEDIYYDEIVYYDGGGVEGYGD